MIHKTRRGALLAQLEHRCVRPGVWVVEGRVVARGRGARPWIVEDVQNTWYRTFEDALDAIAKVTE